MTEHQIQQQIIASFGARPGMRIWRNNTGALRDERGHLVRFGLQGSADILGIMAPHGRLLAIEVKAGAGRQSEQQVRFQEMVTNHGGLYILARSVEDVAAVLGE